MNESHSKNHLDVQYVNHYFINLALFKNPTKSDQRTLLIHFPLSPHRDLFGLSKNGVSHFIH